MKQGIKLFIITIFVLVFITTNVYANGNSYWKEVKTVNISGESRKVNTVYINLNNKNIRLESVLANNKVGEVKELKNMAEKLEKDNSEVIAAVNATFFNAYTDLQPQGTIQSKGKILHIGGLGSVIGFSGDNNVDIRNLKISIEGSINESYEYPNNWYAWGINHDYSDPSANVVYTPIYGDKTKKHNNTSIVISKGKVVKIINGQANIPKEGYTIVLGNKDLVNRFKVGDKVSYRYKFESDGKKISWDNIRTTIGAGPTLLKDGIILADGEKEGFKEDKININRAQRSFIGVTDKNILVIGTVGSVTMKELAEITKNMGLKDAMNLDGGASSGLFYKGSYLTKPGRKISNALVVTKLKEKPIRLKLNGQEVFYDTDPYISNGRTMVPLRGIFETLGATVGWDEKTSSIVAKKDDFLIKLKSGSNIAKINGKEVKLDVPVTIKNGRSHVPVRVAVEAFGGELGWNGNKKMVSMNLDTKDTQKTFKEAKNEEKNGNTNKAKELYLEVLKVDDKHSGALKNLARLLGKEKKYTDAVKYYKDYLEVVDNDKWARSSLGWAYYSLNEMENAEKTFKYLTEKYPDNVSFWMALGAVYCDYNVKEYDESRKCYNTALNLEPNDNQKNTIKNQLEYIEKQD
ncbi:MAG: tetratricopeptide repeat protein [Firmicutes bacterium]|nr:tetratricopeptide repeat protein [Bacillota bacterium]